MAYKRKAKWAKYVLKQKESPKENGPDSLEKNLIREKASGPITVY